MSKVIFIDNPAVSDPDWPKHMPDQGLSARSDEFHLKGTANDHDQQAHAGSRSGGAVPPPIGTAPLPDGHVRAYHWTSAANKDSVAENGLTLATSRGESYGEGTLIHFDADPTAWGPASKVGDGYDFVGDTGRVLVEVAVPEDIYVVNGGFEQQFTIAEDLPPSKILAIHESWHGRLRYFVDEGITDRVKAGEFDDLVDFDDDYAKAIAAIKADEFAADTGGAMPRRFRIPAEFHLQGQHNQKDHGRRYGRTKALSEPDGGFTLDASQLEPFPSGWAVAIGGSDRLLLARDAFDADGEPSRQLVKMTRDRIEAARAAAAPEGTQLAVGGWHNPADGKIEVNVTIVFPQSDEAAARRFAVDNDQIAMANLEAIAAGDWDNAIVDTGGTGGNRDTEDDA